jgi:hypothetical protein
MEELINEEEMYQKIKNTIESVEGDFDIDRLILDASDKLSLPIETVKNIYQKFNNN